MRETGSEKRRREKSELKFIVAHVPENGKIKLYPSPGTIVQSSDRQYEVQKAGNIIRL